MLFSRTALEFFLIQFQENAKPFRLREGLIRSFNVVQCRAAFVGDFLSFVDLFSGPVAEMKLKKSIKTTCFEYFFL